MGAATDRVEELVNTVRNLPTEAEPTGGHACTVRYEPVARLLVHGAGRYPRTAARWFDEIERDLLERGIAKVNITGLPEDELAIQVPQATLEDLGLSLQRGGDPDRGRVARSAGRHGRP
jgi:multidrug efflux pump subunit AcrB